MPHSTTQLKKPLGHQSILDPHSVNSLEPSINQATHPLVRTSTNSNTMPSRQEKRQNDRGKKEKGKKTRNTDRMYSRRATEQKLAMMERHNVFKKRE
jgi:hypothetical protein